MSCVRRLQALSPLIRCAFFAACGDNNSPSNVTAPGNDTTAKTKLLEKGTALLQGKQPLEALNVYATTRVGAAWAPTFPPWLVRARPI